jgi:hypothetical protein
MNEIEIRNLARNMSWSGIIFPEHIYFASIKYDGQAHTCINENDVYDAKLLYVESLLRERYKNS